MIADLASGARSLATEQTEHVSGRLAAYDRPFSLNGVLVPETLISAVAAGLVSVATPAAVVQ